MANSIKNYEISCGMGPQPYHMAKEPYRHENDHEHRRGRPVRGDGNTGAKTKTAAVEMALTEMARRRKLGKALRELAEIPGEELAAGYDFTAYEAREKVIYRFPEGESMRVAEDPLP